MVDKGFSNSYSFLILDFLYQLMLISGYSVYVNDMRILVSCVLSFDQRGLNTKRPTIVFFLGHTKPLQSYDEAIGYSDNDVFKENYRESQVYRCKKQF